MTSDLDVYRTAAVLMREHGDDATIRAAMRADELMDQGDMDGRAVWLRVMAAIKELGAREPPSPSMEIIRHVFYRGHIPRRADMADSVIASHNTTFRVSNM